MDGGFLGAQKALLGASVGITCAAHPFPEADDESAGRGIQDQPYQRVNTVGRQASQGAADDKTRADESDNSGDDCRSPTAHPNGYGRRGNYGGERCIASQEWDEGPAQRYGCKGDCDCASILGRSG